jgi:hypothetical protein
LTLGRKIDERISQYSTVGLSRTGAAEQFGPRLPLKEIETEMER